MPVILATALWQLHGSDKLAPTEHDVLLNHIVRQQLTRLHFDREAHPIDDQFSKDAFQHFIERVDGQKRLLLQSDLKQLKKVEFKIDDHFVKGAFELPAMAAKAVESNIALIEPFVKTSLKAGFNFDREERFETDAEKLKFCENMDELKQRWRLHMKYQCLNHYLTSLETEEAKLELQAKLNKNQTEDSISKEKRVELKRKAHQKTEEQLSSYFKRLKELTHEEHYSRYLNALTAGFDPHTNYMDPETKEDFNIRMSKSLMGIGALLQPEGDFIKVVRIIPGSASYLQGELEAGDIIMRVGQENEEKELDITGMRLREVVNHIRGEKGTTVRLTVKKANGDIAVIPIVRDIVKLESALARSSTLKTKNGKTYGFIHLPDFYRDPKNPSQRNCTADVLNEVNALKKQGIDGLIFDVRSNGGGFLEDARTIAGLFIPRGPIVQVKNTNSQVAVLRDDDNRVDYEGPMVVMVDQYSASASEILAAALQDYGRAVVVGSNQTHGKGTVQFLLDLNREVPRNWKHEDLGNLKLTIQKFYRINGGSTQLEGVKPDIVLPDERSFVESGERFLEDTLAWDEIDPVAFRPWHNNPLPISYLKERSQKRIQASEVFRAIKQRGEDLKTRYENTIVTLSQTAITKERKDNAARSELHQELMDQLKEKIDPIAFAEEQKNKDEAEQREASGNVAKTDKKDKTPDEIKAAELNEWRKSIKYDPYVRESMHILDDLIAYRRTMAIKE